MKTSNKILLTLFALPFIMILFIYASLYAKYKSGDYVTEQQVENERSTLTIVHGFQGINLGGFGRGRISIKHSDSFAVRVDNRNKDQIEFQSQSGVLTLRSKNRHGYLPVTVYCPGFSALSIDSATAEIDPFVLAGVTMDIGAEGNITFNGLADSLTVNIKRNGAITLGNAANVKWLNLQLANGSSFNNKEGGIQQIGNPVLEDSATLNVNGKTMRMIAEKNNP
ncbi:hypothetical protein [Agriterribacter sp.]|uniref:hypothetical protein n=1 Tax=Agriterribacter sp. TaxID=2821509 RepID=UPI002BFBD7AC|nr:hypothetical protein [Agriterribacter sp.]HRP57772.1 DUF2807 domain-containing protein [Agriterribacter sp.]